MVRPVALRNVARQSHVDEIDSRLTASQ